MSPITRLNTVSKGYTGNITFPQDIHRGHFLIAVGAVAATIEFGGGGGLMPLAANSVFEPNVCPISSISVVTTGSYVILQG